MRGVGPRVRERMVRSLNRDRQRLMVRDTDRLLELAAELHAETQNQALQKPSEEELKKVARIERLARRVKDGMRYALGPF